jgi:hypothetical protein
MISKFNKGLIIFFILTHFLKIYFLIFESSHGSQQPILLSGYLLFYPLMLGLLIRYFIKIRKIDISAENYSSLRNGLIVLLTTFLLLIPVRQIIKEIEIAKYGYTFLDHKHLLQIYHNEDENPRGWTYGESSPSKPESLMSKVICIDTCFLKNRLLPTENIKYIFIDPSIPYFKWSTGYQNGIYKNAVVYLDENLSVLSGYNGEVTWFHDEGAKYPTAYNIKWNDGIYSYSLGIDFELENKFSKVNWISTEKYKIDSYKTFKNLSNLTACYSEHDHICPAGLIGNDIGFDRKLFRFNDNSWKSISKIERNRTPISAH